MPTGTKHEPTDDIRVQITALKSFGHTDEEIAKFLQFSVDTLTRHYDYELKTAAIRANSKIANVLYQKAEKGDLQAVIFWLKTRARWRETKEEPNNKDTLIEKLLDAIKNTNG